MPHTVNNNIVIPLIEKKNHSFESMVERTADLDVKPASAMESVESR